MDFQYTPDDDIAMHRENTIRLLCSHFQSHENGLPEWVKNSADEYARIEAPPERRVIVLIFGNARSGQPASISCLDLGGMTSDAIERHFRHWGDPEAAMQGGEASNVQGGHGNGGKCYMTQMFKQYALLHTCTDGLGLTQNNFLLTVHCSTQKTITLWRVLLRQKLI